MSIGQWLRIGCVFQLALASWAGTNDPLAKASSVSQQFVAYAPGPTLPDALCFFAERIKHTWLEQLEASDTWRNPIVLVLRVAPPGPPTNSAFALGVFQVGPILKYEISGWVPPTPDEAALTAAVIEALCLEVANRGRPAGAQRWTSAQIPLWLIHGLAGTLQEDNEWLLTVARRSATALRPPAASALLHQAELPADAVARDLFLADAWLLTESLLRLPDGGKKLYRLLTELRGTNDPFARVYRSEFPDPVALEKWWSLVLARCATTVTPQDLTARATAQQLGALLIMADGQPFNDLYRQADQPALRRAVAQRVEELEQLRSRAHPLYRAALAAYVEAGRWLADEKISRYRRTVARADQLRQEARRQTEAISVTLDWAEQKYPAGSSSANVWQGFFQTIEQLESFKREHRDPIGDYLDKFDP